jgi:hypothetical protein
MPLEVKLIRHRGESRIGLFFEKNADLIARVKKAEGYLQLEQFQRYFYF